MNDEKPDNYRVALIGYGLAGSVFHAPTITCTPGLLLTAIVTSNKDRVQQARHDFPSAKIVGSADEILSSASCSKDYDLVVIAAPNKFHYPLSKAFLESGLAVIVDKPAATNSQEVAELIAISKSRKKLFTVYNNRRWDNDFLTLQKVIAKGLLGPITRFESRFERFRPAPKPGAWRELANPDEAGGLLFDLGSHLIDQACVLFGRPERVYAEVNVVRPFAQVDDDVFVALHYPHGLRAHLWATCVARIGGPRFKLHGLRGSFEKHGLDPQEDALRNGLRPDGANWGREPESLWGRISTTLDGINIDGKIETEPGSYQSFYSNVRDALSGKAVQAVMPEDALLTTRIIEAAFQSAKEAKVIMLN